MRRAAVVVAAAVGLAVVSAILWGHLADTPLAPPDQAPALRPAAAAVAASGPAEPPRLEQVIAAPAARSDIAAGVRNAFRASTDYRDFAVAAMQRPGEGGYFYARYAVQLCAVYGNEGTVRAGIRASVAERGTVSPEQLRAADLLVRQCAGFFPGEAARILREIKTLAATNTDPLVRASESLADAEQAGTPGKLRAAVVQLLDVGDPLLLSESGALDRVARSDAQARAVEGLWLGGRLVLKDSGNDAALAMLALQLGACGESDPCGVDVMVLEGCLSQGLCDADWRKALRQEMLDAGVTPDEIERMLALAARVRRAIDEKDVAFFVR